MTDVPDSSWSFLLVQKRGCYSKIGFHHVLLLFVVLIAAKPIRAGHHPGPAQAMGIRGGMAGQNGAVPIRPATTLNA